MLFRLPRRRRITSEFNFMPALRYYLLHQLLALRLARAVVIAPLLAGMLARQDGRVAFAF